MSAHRKIGTSALFQSYEKDYLDSMRELKSLLLEARGPPSARQQTGEKCSEQLDVAQAKNLARECIASVDFRPLIPSSDKWKWRPSVSRRSRNGI